jgi:hypothetical protein
MTLDTCGYALPMAKSFLWDLVFKVRFVFLTLSSPFPYFLVLCKLPFYNFLVSICHSNIRSTSMDKYLHH